MEGIDQSGLLGHAPIGDLNSDMRTVKSTSGWLIAGVIIATLLAAAALVVILVLYHGDIVRNISGVPPGEDGSVNLLAGAYISVTPDVLSNSITIASTGVETVVAGAGITATTETGVTTVSTTLVDQGLLTESDALGPQVAYQITMTAVPANEWRVTTSAAFPGVFVPGIEVGDGGQGNVGGTAWTAPAVGEYAFNVDCLVTPSAYIPEDYMSASIAISLGATTVNPATGRIPPGGRSTLDLSVGSNGASGPSTKKKRGGPMPVTSAMTASAVVHVCPTCLVQVGQSVTLHTRLDYTSSVLGPDRGTTSTYGILAGSTTTTVGSTTVEGSVGIAPGLFATGPFVVSGSIDLNNTAAIQAQLDLVALFTELDKPCTAVLQGNDLGGLVLGPGVYCYTSSGGLTGTVTLDAQGNPNAQFIFKFGSTLTTAASAAVTLVNGAQACNVYWRIGSLATFGDNNTFAGSVLALTSIRVGTGGSFAGPLFDQNGQVTFNGTSAVSAASGACAASISATANFACQLQVSREK